MPGSMAKKADAGNRGKNAWPTSYGCQSIGDIIRYTNGDALRFTQDLPGGQTFEW